MKTRLVFLLILTIGAPDARCMKIMNHDTLKITGKCTHIGQTQNIIATAYFRFRVLEVSEGSYAGSFITIESDMNNRGYKLYEKIENKRLRYGCG